MILRRILLPVFVFVMIWSCKNDDDSSIIVVPPRPLSEVTLENDASIRSYLETHFYNYEAFENPTEDFDYRIVIDTIAGENSEKTPLMEQVLQEDINISSSDLGLDADEKDIKHTLYYLVIRQGSGNQATVKDSVYLNYQGMRLDGTVFDSRLGSPAWFDLPGTYNETVQSPPSITGFRHGISKFKAGGEIIDNEDGTFEVTGSGIGLIVMPSGLAYFNNTTIGQAYAPLIFEVNLLVAKTKENEEDNVIK